MKHVQFLLAIWKANLQSVMEYRISFLSQVIGMMLNNGIYFLIWVIFFDRFNSVRGWGLTDMYVTFGITASAFGVVSLLFGNAFNLGDIITRGRLDYYLSLPRPVLRALEVGFVARALARASSRLRSATSTSLLMASTISSQLTINSWMPTRPL